MPDARSGVWSLVFLVSTAAGLHLQRNETSSGSQVYRPVLQPSEAVPPTGTYTLNSPEGKPCIKATLGVEYIVSEKKRWYFNLDPSKVIVSGYCDKEAALLSLTLPDNAASLQVSFRKENHLSYVTKLTAHVSPLPVCQNCANKTYSGLLDHEKLFPAATGSSFSCRSESLFVTSSQLSIKLVPLQTQAFALPRGQFGKEVECWADVSKRVVPIAVGAAAVGLLLMAVLTFLFIRDRSRRGYDRI